MLTDDDRIRLATPSGRLMLGPVERERCSKHRRRWVFYRWSWSKDGEISGGDVDIVRGCGTCREEYEDD